MIILSFINTSGKTTVNDTAGEHGAVLLEGLMIFPLVLTFLAGFYLLADLAVSLSYLTHLSRVAAREYMLSQEEDRCLKVVNDAIRAGSYPLKEDRLVITTGHAGLSAEEAADKRSKGLISRFVGGLAESALGVTLTISYEWGGYSLFGLQLPPLTLQQECTVLAGTWKLCFE